MNLYAYCGNNPVGCHDPSGSFAAAAISGLISISGRLIGKLGGVDWQSVGKAVLSGVAAVAGTAIAGSKRVGMAITDIGSKIAGAFTPAKGRKSIVAADALQSVQQAEYDEALENADERRHDDTVIYRWHAATNGVAGFVPSSTDLVTGLSFSTKRGKNSMQTTIGQVASTGMFVVSPPSKSGHVSVFPIDVREPSPTKLLLEWHIFGVESKYTIALFNLCN